MGKRVSKKVSGKEVKKAMSYLKKHLPRALERLRFDSKKLSLHDARVLVKKIKEDISSQ